MSTAAGAGATVAGGLLDSTLIGGNLVGYGRGAARREIGQELGEKTNRATRKLIDVLLGAAAGTTATVNNYRIAASQELGGVATVEAEVLVNRASTAQDVTDFKRDFTSFSTRTYNSSPVANLDGNPLGTR